MKPNTLALSSNPRAPGNYDADKASAEAVLACLDESRTIQSQAVEADINTIVKRFNITGEVPVTSRVPFPIEVDFDQPLDYRTLLDAQIRAAASFNSLPAQVRDTFGHDPLAFVDFATVPENLPKLREWGLAPPAPPEPAPAS